MHRERRLEQSGQALDDGQAQAQAFVLVRRERSPAVDLVELVEDVRQTGLGDADAAVPDLQHELAAARAASHQHATVFAVADGVADQVAQDAFDEQAVSEIGRAHV